MKVILSALAMSTILLACSSDVNNETDKKPTPKQPSTEEVVVNADKCAVMEVEGMVCKMGCAAAIKAELLKTNAVSECIVDFVEEQKTNTVEVQFDSQQLDSTKIVNLIQEINEGQFTVKSYEEEVF